jgi:hypothetical protein
MAWVSLSRCSKPAKSSAGGADGLATGWVAAVCAAAGVPCCSAAKGLDDPPAGDPVPRGLLGLALPAVLGRAGLAVAGDGGDAAAGGPPVAGDPAAGEPAAGEPVAGGSAGGVAGRVSGAATAVCPSEEGCTSGADRAGACAADDELPLKCAQPVKATTKSNPTPTDCGIDNSRGFPCIGVQRYHTRHARTSAGYYLSFIVHQHSRRRVDPVPVRAGFLTGKPVDRELHELRAGMQIELGLDPLAVRFDRLYAQGE